MDCFNHERCLQVNNIHLHVIIESLGISIGEFFLNIGIFRHNNKKDTIVILCLYDISLRISKKKCIYKLSKLSAVFSNCQLTTSFNS